MTSYPHSEGPLARTGAARVEPWRNTEWQKLWLAMQARSWRSLRSRCSTVLVALSVLAGALSLAAGCATTPEQRAATEQAWAERDRVWAAECAQRGGRYISSSCVGFGGP